MQIFKKMLMLHTINGEVAGWCGLNDGADGATVEVEMQGAPSGQMEVTLLAKKGEHRLGVMDAAGKNAQGNWRFAGETKDVTGVRVTHQSVQYTVLGGKQKPDAPKAAGAFTMAKKPMNMPAPKSMEPAMKITEGKAAPKQEAAQSLTAMPQKDEAVPIPVQQEPVPKMPVMQPVEPAEIREENTSWMLNMQEEEHDPVREAKRMLAQVDMRLSNEMDGTWDSMSGKPAAVKRQTHAKELTDQEAQREMPGNKGAMLAQTDMRLSGEAGASSGMDYYKKMNYSPAPIAPPEPVMPAPMPIKEPAFTDPAANEKTGENGARMRELLAAAETDMSQMPREDPLPLFNMPEPTEEPAKKPVSPDLIEVLTLSDAGNRGMEEEMLGEGSGRHGVLGKGVWWRVEQPGIKDWHYLAGELTAKNGARVRAIALEAECNELPENMAGWAQRIDEYYVVLIDAKTGMVLPESAC